MDQIAPTALKPAPRIPLFIEIEFRKNYGRIAEMGVLKNISLSGAFLSHNHHDLEANDKICLTFNVGDRRRDLQAQVVWTNQFGAGIRFLPANKRDVQIVDDLMFYVKSKRESRRFILNTIFKEVA